MNYKKANFVVLWGVGHKTEGGCESFKVQKDAEDFAEKVIVAWGARWSRAYQSIAMHEPALDLTRYEVRFCGFRNGTDYDDGNRGRLQSLKFPDLRSAQEYIANDLWRCFQVLDQPKIVQISEAEIKQT